MKFKNVLIPLTVCIAALVLAKPAHAGTSAYYSECSFIDKGADSGGDVFKMPCYIVEGGNMHGAFFNILWQDGTYTIMSRNTDTGESIGNFSPLVYRDLYENPEGDLIQIGELDYTNDRYDVTEDGLADKIL